MYWQNNESSSFKHISNEDVEKQVIMIAMHLDLITILRLTVNIVEELISLSICIWPLSNIGTDISAA